MKPNVQYLETFIEDEEITAHRFDHMADGKAQGRDLRSIQSNDRHRAWLTEPERATGLQALGLFIGGFLTLAATVGGLGWLIATAIKAAGWDG
ncbi:hypothetical protein JF540_12845 [Salipiger thiooxidans]|uniref:hypothetical protein n=1 Tax=Salipiger thiooxidans TaxID=282683 RepID=UPI001A904367|nr:hypothetical protein [Salipiger thiooxidans]MBN8187578.1 hypothetical protein [Salipiger thiooxidans]